MGFGLSRDRNPENTGFPPHGIRELEPRNKLIVSLWFPSPERTARGLTQGGGQQRGEAWPCGEALGRRGSGVFAGAVFRLVLKEVQKEAIQFWPPFWTHTHIR